MRQWAWALALLLGCPPGVADLDEPKGARARPNNQAPSASAGGDQTVASSAEVVIDGAKSSDPDGDALTFRWTQLGGDAVALSSQAEPQVRFVAPSVSSPTTLSFELKVSDGLLEGQDSVSITVMPTGDNHAPTAVAVLPPTVASGAAATLDGSASSDPDGDSVHFQWRQLSGPAVALDSATEARATFTAPAVTAATELRFQLTVRDDLGASGTAAVATSVLPADGNRPPVAKASAPSSTPPLGPVTLDGSASSDPDGDALTYQWRQLSGPAVTLTGATGAKATFAAPQATSLTELRFSLVVTDAKGLASSPVEVQVAVVPPGSSTGAFKRVVSINEVTRSSVVLFFLTTTAVQATVKYGVASTGESTFTEAAATSRHVVRLTGLRADTRYQYELTAGTAAASGTFQTAFDYQTKPQPFSFAVVGDPRGGMTTWTQVSNAMLAKGVRFVLQNGDNNDCAGSATCWEQYFKAGEALFRNVPVFAAQGNHDVGSNYTVYNLAPQSSSGSELYYAFVYGNAGFVAVNSNDKSGAVQKGWVQSALAAFSGGPSFAFHHHPLYTCGSHSSDPSMQTAFQGLFEGQRLTADLAGHSHALVLWKLVNNNPIRYVTSGGGGVGTSACATPGSTDFNTSSHGFFVVDVDGAQVRLSAYDKTGKQLFAGSRFSAAGPSIDFSRLGSLVNY